MTIVAGWGRYPRIDTHLKTPHAPADVARAHREAKGGFVARGNGRAYGDAAVGGTTTLSTARLDRMLSFDESTGRIEVEAGVLLLDILRIFVPRGFFPPVVPGTQHVTVGGMVAADVHGKNHHRDGGFGRHVERLTLVLPDGETVECGPDLNETLFRATIGGMGLTGTITRASFRLRRVETGWLRQRTIAAPDLDAALAALEAAQDATYSVAWIDGLARGSALGRSLVYVAEHATRDEVAGDERAGRDPLPAPRAARLGVPIELPVPALNPLTVRAFNAAYHLRGLAQARSGAAFLTPWEPYFFPLDGVRDWNRIYGRRGLVQHQCVIPKARARDALGAILERVSRLGCPSFLAVLKLLGPGDGVLSFPLEGYTLALDFAASPSALALLDDLDAVVRDAGGRLYLAKDARQGRETVEAGYGEALSRFRDLRRSIGAADRVSSRLSERLGL